VTVPSVPQYQHGLCAARGARDRALAPESTGSPAQTRDGQDDCHAADQKQRETALIRNVGHEYSFEGPRYPRFQLRIHA
jgi:hypothetical protein